MWVMPSSSARCAQLPRAADKVPFYMALKKFRDYLNGQLEHLDESEVVFDDPKYKNCHESEPKPEIPVQYGPDGLPIDDGKKKRGRPKKNKALVASATTTSNPNDMSTSGSGDGENSSNKQMMASSSNNSVNSQMCNELGQNNNGQMMQGMMPTFDLSKKKRGRPKKQKGMENAAFSGQQQQQQPSQPKQKQAKTPKASPMPPQSNINMQQQQQQQTQSQQQQPPQTHFNSQNFNMMHNPVDTLTPPPSVGYQQNSMGYNGTTMKNHPGYQQSPQPNSQCYSTPSDMSSDISGATITNDHNSPTTATTPIDFNPASNDNNTNECRFSSPASTISEQQSHNMTHRQHSTLDMNYQSSPYSTPNRNQTPNGGVTDQNAYGNYGASTGDHLTSQYQSQMTKQQQTHHHSPSFSPHLSNNPQGARNSPQTSHKMQQQQQPTQGNSSTKEYGTSSNTDVATKSLSGLESLVNEIPTESERLSHQSAADYALKSEASSLLSDTLAQYSSNPHATDCYNPYSSHVSSLVSAAASSSFSSVPPQFSSSSHYSGIANPTPSSYNMSNPFSVNNLLTPNHSYNAAAAAAYAKAGPPAPPPPGHHLTPTNHLFMEPPHMPVAMFPYTQQPSYTYPTGAPHPSLLNPSYPHPYSPYSNPGFTSHHMFDRF